VPCRPIDGAVPKKKHVCTFTCHRCDIYIYINKNATVRLFMYQAGRYISSNGAVWRILSFPIHERSPAVVHVAVHLENGQRGYSTAAHVQQVALHPPATTLTAFFALCQKDAFAKTPLFSEVPKYYTWNASRKSFHRKTVHSASQSI
jgi:hypothetical protein